MKPGRPKRHIKAVWISFKEGECLEFYKLHENGSLVLTNNNNIEIHHTLSNFFLNDSNEKGFQIQIVEECWNLIGKENNPQFAFPKISDVDSNLQKADDIFVNNMLMDDAKVSDFSNDDYIWGL